MEQAIDLYELKKFCDTDIDTVREKFKSVTDKLAWNRNTAMNLDLDKIKKELNVENLQASKILL